MSEEIVKEYSNGEITIVWKPATCIHSTICWKAATGLSSVFNPRERPWININGASTARIVEQVNQCPSKALTFYYNDAAEGEVTIESDTKIEVLKNGPLLVYGNVKVKDSEGNETKKSNVTAFCRCGHSQNKPYCDGSHVKEGFNG